MKIIVSILLFIVLCTSDLYAQHKFGDIKVESMSELFNPANDNLWSEKGQRDNYRFNKNNSSIWSIDQFATLSVYDDRDKRNRVNLIAKDDLKYKELKQELVPDLINQFGKFKKVTIDHPFVIPEGQQVDMLKWKVLEGKKKYEIYFGETYPDISMIIFQK